MGCASRAACSMRGWRPVGELRPTRRSRFARRGARVAGGLEWTSLRQCRSRSRRTIASLEPKAARKASAPSTRSASPSSKAAERKERVNAETRIVLMGVLALTAWLAGCAGIGTGGTADYRAIVASPDRTDADRQTDQRRSPELLLAFTGVRPGIRVLDMGAGAGYSTELLARAVGPRGTVYAQDAPAIPERPKARFH